MSNTKRTKRTKPRCSIKPGVMILNIRHDDFCPAIRTQRSSDCHPLCKPITVLLQPTDKTEGGKTR